MINSPDAQIRVLLVDDHQIILDGLAALINAEINKMKVVGRTSIPTEVFSLFQEQNPDVVVLDIDLGKHQDGTLISGVELLPKLVNDYNAKVLMLTGDPNISVRAEAVTRGAKGVVLKNAPGETIIQAIKKVASGNRWHSDDILDYLSTQKVAKPETDHESSAVTSLTPTQLQVVAKVVANATLTNKQIAKLLNMSEHTLKNHLTEINSKLNTKNKMDLFIYAKKHGLDKLSP